jgi:hypothetical protein
MEEEAVSFSAVFFAKEERVSYRREERESKDALLEPMDAAIENQARFPPRSSWMHGASRSILHVLRPTRQQRGPRRRGGATGGRKGRASCCSLRYATEKAFFRKRHWNRGTEAT